MPETCPIRNQSQAQISRGRVKVKMGGAGGDRRGNFNMAGGVKRMATAWFMVEVRVTGWRRSVAWYREVLALRVVLDDPDHEFALLEAGRGGGRVAIKGGWNGEGNESRRRSGWCSRSRIWTGSGRNSSSGGSRSRGRSPAPRDIARSGSSTRMAHRSGCSRGTRRRSLIGPDQKTQHRLECEVAVGGVVWLRLWP